MAGGVETRARLNHMSIHRTQAVNKILDGAVLCAAASAATILPLPATPPSAFVAFILVAGSVLFVWMVGARVLGHYDAENRRSARGDIALTGVLVVSVLGPFAAVHDFFAVLADPIRF